MHFHGAQWVRAGSCEGPYLRKTFQANGTEQASIDICGLGFFQLYVNGIRVSEDVLVPAWTDYEDRGDFRLLYPLKDRFSHRILYLHYELSAYLKKGENVIGVLLGNGWYNQHLRNIEGDLWYGLPKLFFDLTLTSGTVGASIPTGMVVASDGSGGFGTAAGSKPSAPSDPLESMVTHIVSDGTLRWTQSHLVENNLYFGERQDLSLKLPEFSLSGFIDSGWRDVEVLGPVGGALESAAEALGSATERLEQQQCPADRRIRECTPRKVRTFPDSVLYDCGENLAGWVRLRYLGKSGGEVRILHAETLTESDEYFGEMEVAGNPEDAGKTEVVGKSTCLPQLSFSTTGTESQIQMDTYVNVPEGALLEPEFDWHGFRYFQVFGEAEPEAAVVIHTDLAATSSFSCGNEVLNWLYDSMLKTYLGNLHLGVPSDCPHRERLGYTGDGQLVCETGLLLTDSASVYTKWVQDIADGQDPDSGHVQHTAPFYGGGGGPGGWGCAIVEVPWQLYRHDGDKRILERYWPNMLKYVEYMLRHSGNGLVVSEEEGGWCLGDWCAPPETVLPIPFVNTWFLVRTMGRMQEMAEILGSGYAFSFETELATAKAAMIRSYFDSASNTFCEGLQGADAFALDIGLGNPDMLAAMVRRYEESGVIDTGIFGTEVLLRVLFESGHAQTAYKLLTTRAYPSFGHMMEKGATTLWEDWHGLSSNNHPMFGACTKLLFSGILGIRQAEGGTAFSNVVLEPIFVEGLDWAEGELGTQSGRISVRWEREKGKESEASIKCTFRLEEGIRAEFKHEGKAWALKAGMQEIRIQA